MAKDKGISDKVSLYSKLLAMQENCSGVVEFDSVNPHFKNKYASLETVLHKLLKIANEIGLVISQRIKLVEGFWCVITLVTDETETLELSCMPIINPKQDAQGFGSALSYAKRYSLMAAFCMVGGLEDDDAETASGRPTGTKLPPKVSTYQGTDADKGKLGTMMKTVGIVDQNAMRNTAMKCMGKEWSVCEMIIAEEAALMKDFK